LAVSRLNHPDNLLQSPQCADVFADEHNVDPGFGKNCDLDQAGLAAAPVTNQNPVAWRW